MVIWGFGLPRVWFHTTLKPVAGHVNFGLLQRKKWLSAYAQCTCFARTQCTYSLFVYYRKLRQQDFGAESRLGQSRRGWGAEFWLEDGEGLRPLWCDIAFGMVWRSVRHSSHVTRQHVTHHLHQHGERNSCRNASTCVESASRARGHRRSSSMLEHTRVHRVRTRAHSRANSLSKHSACARVFETWEA